MNKKADSKENFCHSLPMFKNYADVCSHLDSLGLFHMDLSLSRMDGALQALQLTEPPFPVVQIVGTNGKGSTSTFLESLARAHHLHTGLFTSPHFVSPRERICLNGQPLAEEAWAELATKVYNAAPQLTYFEFLTVLAVLAFHEAQVDIAIIEAGLGGHYDATTALQRHALCLTPISMDHERVLGSTLLAIAADKAQAICPHMPVFLGEQEPAVHDFIQKISQERHAVLQPICHELLPSSAVLGLHGVHQEHNAALALTAWQKLSQRYAWSYDEEHIREGLRTAFIAGRLQSITCHEEQLPPHMILDGAHNVHGLQSLIAYIESLSTKPSAIVFSCLADKDRQSMLTLLQELHKLCHFCPFYVVDIQNNERALSPQEKTDLVREIACAKSTVYAAQELHQSLAHICTQHTEQEQHAPVLLCGSLYLLGEFYEKYPQYLSNMI